MKDVGGQWITGTVRGPGAPTQIRPMSPAEDQDIETVVVDWDDHRGSDTVAKVGLEPI